MDNGAIPTLELGFAITTGGSDVELERLRAIMNSSEATALKAAAQVERAFNGLNLGGAAGAVASFGNVTTREMARAEKAGERLVAQLQRQTEQFGKTGAEIRNMRIDKLAADLDRLGNTDLSGRLRTFGRELDRLEGGTTRVAGSAGKMRYAMAGASNQVQDFFVQLSMHANPINAFVVQSGQLAGQFMHVEGRAGAAARFLMGPWGLALQIGALALAPMVAKIWEGSEADKAAAEAKEKHRKAVLDLADAQSKAIQTAERKQALDTAQIKIDLDAALAVRQRAQAEMERARAALGALSQPGVASERGIGIQQQAARDQIAALERQMAANAAALSQLQRGFDLGFSRMIQQQREAASTPQGRIEAKYRDLIQTAMEQLAGVANGPRLATKLDELYAARERELKAIEKSTQVRDQETLTAMSVAKMLRGALPGVQITSTTGGVHTPGSYHYKNQAVDFVPGGGMGSMTKADVRRIFESRGIDIVELLGPGDAGHSNHFHVAWTKGRLALDAFNDSAKLAEDRKRELEALMKLFDPAAAAADEYRQAIEKIDRLKPPNADGMRDAARSRFLKARADAFELPDIDRMRKDNTAQQEFDSKTLQPLRDQLALYGLVGAARDKAALDLEREGFLTDAIAKGIPDVEAAWQHYYGLKSQLIGKDAAAEAEVERIKRMQDELDRLVAAANAAGDAMARAFGRVGGAIGDAVALLADYGKRQNEIDEQVKAKKLDKGEAAAASARLQLDTTTRLIGATKTLFNERIAGYKAMEAAEKALAVVQLARTAIDVAGGAARMFASLGPLAFPAVAAMLAVMASLGFRGGGGGGAAKLPTSNTGTGTVLGDKDAKSESLKRSIDQLRDVDTLTLNASRQMAASLRSIDNQIGGLATVLVRSGNIDANASVAQGFKPNAIGSVLGSIPLIGGFLGGLFGTKTKVIGSGIYGGNQSLADILAGGYNAQSYSDIQRKKSFFGITTSTKNSTVYGGALDGSVTAQFALILKSFNDAILAAAGPLGTATADITARLSSFVFGLGKIDLTGLSGTEIQEKLGNIFGAAADQMALAAFPGIDRFQKVGEGAFETLVRVASTVEAVTSTLDRFGSGLKTLSIDAKVALAAQFDSLGDFANASQSYFETYFTRGEQAAARAAQLTKVFDSLGLKMPTTLAAFRALVDAQDLTTAAGQANYAILLKLAPVFADLQGAFGAAKTAADAAAALREAWQSIGDGIMEEVERIRALSNGDTGASFAVLQGRFNVATEAARAGDQEMAKALPGLSQGLLAAAEKAATSRQELERVRAQTAASLEGTYASVMARANAGDPGSITDILDRITTTQAASTQQAANDVVEELRIQTNELREALDQVRQDNSAGQAQIAANTGRAARVLTDATQDSGGRGFQMYAALEP